MTEKQNGNGNTNCGHTGILKKEKSQDPIGKKKRVITKPSQTQIVNNVKKDRVWLHIC